MVVPVRARDNGRRPAQSGRTRGRAWGRRRGAHGARARHERGAWRAVPPRPRRGLQGDPRGHRGHTSPLGRAPPHSASRCPPLQVALLVRQVGVATWPRLACDGRGEALQGRQVSVLGRDAVPRRRAHGRGGEARAGTRAAARACDTPARAHVASRSLSACCGPPRRLR